MWIYSSTAARGKREQEKGNFFTATKRSLRAPFEKCQRWFVSRQHRSLSFDPTTNPLETKGDTWRAGDEIPIVSTCFQRAWASIENGVIFKGHIVRALRTDSPQLPMPFHSTENRFGLIIILSFLFLSAKTTKRNLFVPIFMKNCIHLRIFSRVRECLNEKCFRPTVFSVKIFPGKFDSDSERITIRYQAIGYENSRGNERYLDSYWFSMLEIRIRVTGLLLHSVNV